MDPLSIAAGIIAVLQLTEKVCGVWKDAKDASEDRIQFTSDISNLTDLIVKLVSRLDEDSTDAWHADVRALLKGKNGLINQYRTALEQMRQKIAADSRRERITKTLLWKHVRDDVKQILSGLERLKSFVQIALQMDHLKLSSAIEGRIISLQGDNKIVKERVESIGEHQDRQRHSLIMDWLSSDDFPAQHADMLSRRQTDTGLWFLDAPIFTDWVHGTSKTLFCPGIPGAGKTVMAATAVDHLYNTVRAPGVGVAYVYCNYKRQAEQTGPYLISAILRQLVQDQPSIPQTLSTLFDEHQKKRTRPSLEETLNVLHSVLTIYRKVYVVIDALDECSEQDGTRRKILNCCRKLQEQADLRLMATSRSMPDIVDEFKGMPSLEVRASSVDVKRFVEGKFDELPRCVQHDSALQELVQEKVAEAVDGMFLLARLHVDSLIDKKTKTKVTKALQNLSKGTGALEKAYNDAIFRIDGQLPDDCTLAKTVLSWISYACRPLTTGELCHALAVNPGDEELDSDNIYDVEDILSVCAGLVTIDEESQVIRLVHYTTQDYLESIREKWSPEAEYDLASTCLTYLCFRAFSSGSCPSDEEFERRLADHEFLDYSARYWHRHVATIQEDLSDLAMSLLQDNMRVACVLQITSMKSKKYQWYSQEHPRRATGLHLAVSLGLLQLSKKLLRWAENEGIEIADARDSDGRTPLVWASREGHQATAELILSTAKVDIEARDRNGLTSLAWAAVRGHADTIELLISRGKADVEATNGEEKTPLMWAAILGKVEAVKALISFSKANVEARDDRGLTPLRLAAEYRQVETVKALISLGKADVEGRDNEGSTPLIVAAREGPVETVEALLSLGKANVEARDNKGSTPLIVAATEGPVETVKALLSLGKANVEARDNKGTTPLMWAAYMGSTEAIKVLISLGQANVEAKDEDGQTPLMLAAHGGEKDAINLLIGLGKADLNVRNDVGQTALDLAASYGHEDVVELIQRYIEQQ